MFAAQCRTLGRPDERGLRPSAVGERLGWAGVLASATDSAASSVEAARRKQRGAARETCRWESSIIMSTRIDWICPWWPPWASHEGPSCPYFRSCPRWSPSDPEQRVRLVSGLRGSTVHASSLSALLMRVNNQELHPVRTDAAISLRAVGLRSCAGAGFYGSADVQQPQWPVLLWRVHGFRSAAGPCVAESRSSRRGWWSDAIE